MAVALLPVQQGAGLGQGGGVQRRPQVRGRAQVQAAGQRLGQGGEQVVVEGAGFLADGDRVRVVAATEG